MEKITLRVQSSLDYQVAEICAEVSQEELENGIQSYLIDTSVQMVREASNKLGSAHTSNQPVRTTIKASTSTAPTNPQPKRVYQQPRYQPQPEEVPTPMAQPQSNGYTLLTESQKAYLQTAIERGRIDPNTDLEHMSKTKASELIATLKPKQ